MADLSHFPITQRWVPRNPDKLQLFSFPTPNGIKVSIALEEVGLPYEVHRVTQSPDDVRSDAFKSLNPNAKIPAIIDPNGPDGSPIALFESGAILLYLGEKTGQLIGATPSDKAQITQWVMFQMAALGPMLGQLGFFVKFAGAEWDDKRPRDRYAAEGKRLLSVLAAQLADRDWIAGDYSIADIAIAPWLNALSYYGTRGHVDWEEFPVLDAYLDRFLAREAVARGLNIPPREG